MNPVELVTLMPNEQSPSLTGFPGSICIRIWRMRGEPLKISASAQLSYHSNFSDLYVHRNTARSEASSFGTGIAEPDAIGSTRSDIGHGSHDDRKS